LVVNARDNRGAISYDTKPLNIRIKTKPVLSFGFFELGWFEIALIIILLVITGGSLSSWYYIVEKEKKSAYGIVASRDVAKMSKLLGDNLAEIKAIIKRQKKLDKGIKPQLQTAFKKMRINIDNMKKYLGKAIEKSK